MTQKTAWFMLHRIREAMADEWFDMMTGPVEADETYVGGLVKNRKPLVRKRGKSQIGPERNDARHGNDSAQGEGSRLIVVEGTGAVELHGAIQDNVKQGEIVYTDGHLAYKLSITHKHYRNMIHPTYAYARGHIHTNSSFLSVSKRTIKGTYIAPRPKHFTALR